MGKKSRERMTGRTEEERITKPRKLSQNRDAEEDLAASNKEKTIFRYFAQLLKTGKLGKLKKVEGSE